VRRGVADVVGVSIDILYLGIGTKIGCREIKISILARFRCTAECGALPLLVALGLELDTSASSAK
jgi:hypothetical protein